MIGTSPLLPLNATVNDQVPMQYDFRQMYSTVMQDWFCMSSNDAQTVLGSNFEKLPIFSSVVLPLEDITLAGQYFGGQTRLNFKVEDNTHYDSFSIEFSTDGRSFTQLQNLPNNSLNDTENYTYLHVINLPAMYYRVKGFLKQNRIKYSNTVLLRSNDKQQLISVYPNPVTNHQINIRLFENATTDVDVTIYDLIGAKVYYNRVSPNGSLISLKLPASFSRNSHYIVEVKYGNTTAREQILFQ